MKRILCILSLAIMASCGQSNSKRPQNLIPESQMVQVLADIHIAEARIENRVVYPDTALIVFDQEQRRILEKHGLEEEQFRETYQYYLSNLKAMDKLYETILDTLSVREAKLRSGDTTATKPVRPERTNPDLQKAPSAVFERAPNQ